MADITETERAVLLAQAQMIQASIMDAITRCFGFNKDAKGEVTILLVPSVSALASVFCGLIAAQANPEDWMRQLENEIRRQYPAALAHQEANLRLSPEVQDFLSKLTGQS